MIETRFDHVGLNVIDLDASIAFLKAMFGFEIIQRWEEPRQAFVGGGNVVLGLIEQKDYDFTRHTMAHIAFPCRREEFCTYCGCLRDPGPRGKKFSSYEKHLPR